MKHILLLIFYKRTYFLQTPPYGYYKKSPELLTGNDRFEGFTIDLIGEIANILQFNYEFERETRYGSFDNVTRKWDGMVQQIREEVGILVINHHHHI